MSDMDDRLELEPLDPAYEDPGFWIRVHGRVMAQAKEELSRRQMTDQWSIADVVFQWRRTLVPLALLAATLAGISVVGHEEPMAPLPSIALEEALMEGLSGEPIPTVLERTAELDEVLFLTGSGGF